MTVARRIDCRVRLARPLGKDFVAQARGKLDNAGLRCFLREEMLDQLRLSFWWRVADLSDVVFASTHSLVRPSPLRLLTKCIEYHDKNKKARRTYTYRWRKQT